MGADETPEDRLEAALERIARSIDAPRLAVQNVASPGDTPLAADVAARLDRIIDTLRDALGK